MIKLFVDEEGSVAVRRLAAAADKTAAAAVAYPEARAALARLGRLGALGSADAALARRELEKWWSEISVIQTTEELCREAGDLAEHFSLRGFDAIHLAAFAVLARHSEGEEVLFSSYDARLARAARELAGGRAGT